MPQYLVCNYIPDDFDPAMLGRVLLPAHAWISTSPVCWPEIACRDQDLIPKR